MLHASFRSDRKGDLIMRIALIALCALALAGCGHQAKDPPRPPVAVEVLTVEVPTPVACIDLADIPGEPPQIAGALTGDARQDVLIFAASAAQLRAWGGRAVALLSGCTRRPPSGPP